MINFDVLEINLCGNTVQNLFYFPLPFTRFTVCGQLDKVDMCNNAFLVEYKYTLCYDLASFGSCSTQIKNFHVVSSKRSVYPVVYPYDIAKCRDCN